jgi:spore coat protein U-like protein
MNKLFIILLFFSTFLQAQWEEREGVFYINGNAVKDIELSLALSAIDFGDVYSDSEVDSVAVDFTVNAENSYDYTVEISNDDNTGVIEVSRTASEGYTAGTVTYIATATGVEQLHTFYVDLNTASITGDLSATITVLVAYNDIPE